MSTNTPSPGWYADPENNEQFRWWNGAAWTEQTRGADPHGARPQLQGVAPGWGSAHAVQPGPRKKPWYFRWWAIAAAVFVVLGVIGSLAPGEEEAPTTDATSSESKAEAATGITDPSETTEAEPEPVDTDGDGVFDDDDYRPKDAKVQTEDDVDTDKDGVADYKDAFPKNARYSKDTDEDGVADQLDAFPKDAEFSKDSDGDRVADSVDAFPQDPSKSKITLAMENALGAAENYLDFSAFSRQGLIEQLSSEYGSGFELADATWAVDQLKVNWNEQAVKAARNYLDFSSFSRQGLIEQLSSPYGSQFTLAQATYAVNKIGL